MDLLGVNMKSKKQSKRSKKGIKVVYISSPMKVETCASKFRALVQQLTGKDSDAARFMDFNGPAENSLHVHETAIDDHIEQELAVPSTDSYNYESSSPANSDSIFESFDSFMSMFQPNFLHESAHELHAFN